MAFTDQDAADLKSISKGNFINKDGPRKGAWDRQYGKTRKTAEAAPVPTGPIGSANPQNADALKAAGMKKGGRVRATGFKGYGAARKV